MKTTITLSYRLIAVPKSWNGFTWIADPQHDYAFDAYDYAEAYNLDAHDIDVETIKCVQDAVNNNFGGTRWIEVTHEKIIAAI